MIAGRKYNGLQIDLWSCGVILYAMVCGNLPFEDPNTSQLYKKIITLDYTVPTEVSPCAKYMIEGLLTSHTKRFTLEQIRNHEFYKLCSQPRTAGIIIGRDNIPIDDNVLQDASRLGYDSHEMEECLQANKHNAATTAYYLVLKARKGAGLQSYADMNSARFDTSLLRSAKIKALFGPKHRGGEGLSTNK